MCSTLLYSAETRAEKKTNEKKNWAFEMWKERCVFQGEKKIKTEETDPKGTANKGSDNNMRA